MKNKMMRLASLLMVAVLLTTSVVSGTYAKYTTEHEATTSARVARWGFDGTTFTLDNLFKPAYDGTVESENGTDKVLAPGTWGSQVIAFTTESGKAPEVDYSFTVDASTTTPIDSPILTNPNILWSFHKMGEAATWGTFDVMLGAINAMEVATVEANTLPALSGNYVIEWKWIFTNSVENDIRDTAMGNADTLATVDLTIKINATQID